MSKFSDALKAKLKFDDNLVENMRKEEKTGGDDPRLLEYYNMKPNEEMRLLIIPDVNGAIWTKFGYHGGRKLNLEKGTKDRPDVIRCARVTDKGDCDVCNEHMFPMYTDAKELAATDPASGKVMKEYANRFQTTDVTYASVLVLSSPCEISYPTDGNQVKLIRLPKKVEDMIRATIDNGELTKEDLLEYPLILRKKENEMKMADYSTSSFSRQPVSEDELDFFEDQLIDVYDYNNLDDKLIPPVKTKDEQMDWIEKADAAIEQSDQIKLSGGKEPKQNQRSSGGVRGQLEKRMKQNNPEQQEEEPDHQEEEPDHQEKEPEQKVEEKSAEEKSAEEKSQKTKSEELRAKLLKRKSQ